ncbi:hypothetical protein PO909_002457 [Leuciscus waleckii]
MQQINTDIDYLKRTMGTQVAACEMLREVFEKLDGRLTAVEGHCDPDAICLSAVETQPGLAPSVTGLPLAVLERPMGPGPVSCPPSAADGCSTAARGETDGGRPAQSVDPALGRTQTPPWSMVVKDGCRLKQVSENPAHRSPTPRTVKTPARRVHCEDDESESSASSLQPDTDTSFLLENKN